ncbi:MAG: DUF3829 domain-containing protein [Deltaproteobacteria bacterium]|nr:DUF3829 domain-containing protein [Deltaproteobacteria bacterium]
MKATRACAVCLFALVATLQPQDAMARGKRDVALAKKMNPYVDALNGASAQLFKARKRYFAFAHPQKGPDCSVGYRVKAPGKLFSVSRYVKNIKKAKKARPRLRELEKAGVLYIAALAKAEKIMEQVDTYYKSRAYKKDNCAKGKALHPKLMAVWAEFLKGDRAIRNFLDKQQIKRDEQQLKEIKRKYGKRLRYYHRAGVSEAKKLLMLFKSQFRQKTPDLAAVKAACDKFETLAKGIAATQKQYKKDAQKCMFHAFARHPQHFLQAARAVVSTFESKRKFSKSELGRLRSVRGSIPYLFDRYNQLVKASNGVRFYKNTR